MKIYNQENIAPKDKIITIEGGENYNKFKAKYPAGAVELKYILLDFEELEDGSA